MIFYCAVVLLSVNKLSVWALTDFLDISLCDMLAVLFKNMSTTKRA